MFQSEHLQEKWAPLLNHEGLDKIEDSHKRAVTATLLENQEKFLREQQAFAQSGSFLTEQPNVNTDPAATGNAGFSGAGASPVAGFDPVLISLIRRSMPNLVAYDLELAFNCLCLVLLDSSSRCVLSTTPSKVPKHSTMK